MMKVPLNVLKKLAAKQVVEAENDGKKFFKEFEAALQSAMKASKMRFKDDDDIFDDMYRKIRNGFLRKRCPPIEFVSQGSSRAAFALDGALCLKIATNKAGTAQNKAEAQNTKSAKGLGIFPEIHQIGKNWLCMLVDCVTPGNITSDILKEFSKSLKFFGWKKTKIGKNPYSYPTPAVPIAMMLEHLVEEQPGDWAEILKSYVEKSDDKAMKEVAQMMLNPQNVGQKILSRIAKWTAEHSSNFDPCDLESMHNWGLAMREGEIVPVILDAGFSPKVRDEFY